MYVTIILTRSILYYIYFSSIQFRNWQIFLMKCNFVLNKKNVSRKDIWNYLYDFNIEDFTCWQPKIISFNYIFNTFVSLLSFKGCLMNIEISVQLSSYHFRKCNRLVEFKLRLCSMHSLSHKYFWLRCLHLFNDQLYILVWQPV